MSTEAVPEPPLGLAPSDDPFFYGWRYVERTDEHGEVTCVRVPLTEWDVLHPQEDDFIVQTDAHQIDCLYLFGVIREVLHNRPDAKVFCDMRIDWEEGEDSVFGPDIVVFEDLESKWPPNRGTFPVKTMGVNPVVVVEVISPSTQRVDRGTKVSEYYRMGVPLYAIVDRKEVSGNMVFRVYGYQATEEGYEPIPDDPRGIWIDFLCLWIRAEGDRIACFDEQGIRFPDREEWAQERERLQALASAAEKKRKEATKQADQEKQRAEQAKLQAEQEKQRAEQEKQRAEQEKQRAEQEKQRAEQEKQRAEQEKQRAEQGKQRAEQEKQRAEKAMLRAEAAERREAQEIQRAEDTARKLADLEAELRRLRGETD